MIKVPQAPVALREPGIGYTLGGQFGFDIVPISPTGEAPQFPPVSDSPAPLVESAPVLVAPPSRVASAATLTDSVRGQFKVAIFDSPRAVIASAKARVKELRAELKRMKSLQRELAELERLLRAAREKPTAAVRAIRRVG